MQIHDDQVIDVGNVNIALSLSFDFNPGTQEYTVCLELRLDQKRFGHESELNYATIVE